MGYWVDFLASVGCVGAWGVNLGGVKGGLGLKRDDLGLGRGCYWAWVWCDLEHHFGGVGATG